MDGPELDVFGSTNVPDTAENMQRTTSNNGHGRKRADRAQAPDAAGV